MILSRMRLRRPCPGRVSFKSAPGWTAGFTRSCKMHGSTGSGQRPPEERSWSSRASVKPQTSARWAASTNRCWAATRLLPPLSRFHVPTLRDAALRVMPCIPPNWIMRNQCICPCDRHLRQELIARRVRNHAARQIFCFTADCLARLLKREEFEHSNSGPCLPATSRITPLAHRSHGFAHTRAGCGLPSR